MEASDLHDFFTYSNGHLYWKKDVGRWGRIKAGTLVGSLTHYGYLDVGVKGRLYKVHRIIWTMHNGRWPTKIVDHINGNKADNRIENLREASDAVNAENKHVHQSNNKIGFLGVTTHPPYFRARIKARGQTFHIGLFASPEEAHAAYLKAKRRLHEGCTI